MSSLYIRYFFIVFCSLYIFNKLFKSIINLPKLLFLTLSISLVTFFSSNYSLPLAIFLMLTSTLLFIYTYCKINIFSSINIVLLTYGLSFVFLNISTTFIVLLFLFFYKQADLIPYTHIDLPTGILHLLFIYCICKSKRICNGIYSIANTSSIITSTILSTCFITYITFISSNKETLSRPFRAIAIILFLLFSLFFIYYWRYRITKTYREKLRIANEKSLEDELNSQKEMIADLEADNARLSQIVHKDNKIILAMLTAVTEHLENTTGSTPEELAIQGKELSAQLQDMAKDRQGILSTQTRKINALPKSGLHTVDGMLSFMETRAKENGITYKLQIADNMKEIAGNAIPEADVLHLLGDLIDNAIIATKHTNDKKEILIYLGNLQNHFLLEISDSGIPFSLDTYQSLGNEPHTTHSDDGGSGIGLMDIWKLKKKYKASLHIYEYEEGESIFTKKLTFIFDRKNHFLLQTPRHKEASHTIIRGDLYIFPNRSDASIN